MKSATLLICLLLILINAAAQDYKCLQPGQKHYFTNSKHYLRGIRIDSVHTYADSTVYYPYRTTRGDYISWAALDTNGGSWVGKRVVELNDGTFLFDNIWGRKSMIMSRAAVGDSWNFYTDETDTIYTADVQSIEEVIIGGVADSVKTILIRAYDNVWGGYRTTDPADSMLIRLSKNHGFYELADLYLFPHRRVNPYPGWAGTYDTLDFYFQECEEQQFKYTELHLPAKEEMYDYQPGDIFEYIHCCNSDATHGMYERIKMDTIISRTETSTQITYTRLNRYIKRKYGPMAVFFVGEYIDTFTIDKGYMPIIDTLKMPEEPRFGSVWYYNPQNVLLCHTSDWYSWHNGLFAEFEPCHSRWTYKLGMGKTGESHCYDPTPGPGSGEYEDLIFCRKNGISCGKYVSVSVENDLATESKISCYPNPADNELRLNYNSATSYTLYLADITGRIVYAATDTEPSHTVKTNKLPPGLYMLTIADESGALYHEKVAVSH